MDSPILPSWFPGDLPVLNTPTVAPLTVVSDGPNAINCSFGPLLERHSPSYTILTNAIVFSSDGIFATENFLLTYGTYHLPQWLPALSDCDFADHAIAFAHRHANCYGHLINEILPSYLCIPAEIWAKSVFFISPHIIKQVAIELIELCGKSPVAVRPLYRSLFSQQLYVPNPPIFLDIWPECLRAMHDRIIGRLNLSHLVPANSVIAQRTRNRRIQNLDALFRAAVNTFSDRNWMIRVNISKTMAEEISFFANVTLLLIVRGSIGANVVWMRPHTVLIEMHLRYCEHFYADVGRALGLKVFEVNLNQSSPHQISVNIGIIMAIIRQAREYQKVHPP
jgi:hypothetical protein